MGVRYLTNYILHSKEAAASWDKTFKLRNTRLVIDGGGLRCILLAVSGPEGGAPDARCGGQYTDYHTRICAFFSELRQNGVQPLVILDGVSEPEKEDTSNIRAQQRAKSCRELSEWKGRGELPIDLQEGAPLPLWANVVFVQALIASQVAVVRTDYEADSSIAAVARQYKCPVLTADSDFFIYDLPGGVVHLKRLDFKDDSDSHSSQPILFRRSLFASALQRTRNLGRFSCDTIEEVLPLAATLSGNDFVPSTLVERLYYPKFGCRPHRFVQALEWLLLMESITSLQRDLPSLLSKLPAAVHEGVKHSVEMYRPEETIAQALVKRCLDEDQLKAPFHIKDNGGEIAGAATSLSRAFSHQPGWLMELFHLGLVAPLPFLRYENSLSRISPCLESFEHSPVSNIDEHLRSKLLGLVCQDKATVKKMAHVDELVRVFSNHKLVPPSDDDVLKKVELRPDTLKVDEKILSVANVSDVSVSERRNVLLRALESGTESIAVLDLTLQLPVATLRYLWSRMEAESRKEAESRRGRTPHITLHHLQVLLLGIAEACKSDTDALPYLDHVVSIPAMRSSLSSWHKDDELREGDDEDRKKPEECFRGCFDSTIVHIFNAWQRILDDVLQLNYALSMPFPTPFLHGLYDGVHNYALFSKVADGDVFHTVRGRRRDLARSLWQALTAKLDGFEAATSGAASTAATDSSSKERGKGDKKKRKAPSSVGKKSGSGNRFALLGCE